VLEFICTKETASVQTGCPGKTHWSLLGGTPWLKYRGRHTRETLTDNLTLRAVGTFVLSYFETVITDLNASSYMFLLTLHRLVVCVSYSGLFASARRYYHLFLAKNSTAAAGHLFVDASELEAALSAIFATLNHEPVAFPTNVDATRVYGTVVGGTAVVRWLFQKKYVECGTSHHNTGKVLSRRDTTGSATDPLPMLVAASSSPSATEVPYFFHVPKAAGTSIERILATKRKMKTLPSGDLEDLRWLRWHAFQQPSACLPLYDLPLSSFRHHVVFVCLKYFPI
jgi:hypothetical protein